MPAYQEKEGKTGGRRSGVNATGIPDRMKRQFESSSGFSFDDVRVHYNSGLPAAVNAYAYTQGSRVYVGPGQERHLWHELGHVVQQKQGIVRPTGTIKGVLVNTDAGLERGADALARRARGEAAAQKGEAAVREGMSGSRAAQREGEGHEEQLAEMMDQIREDRVQSLRDPSRFPLLEAALQDFDDYRQLMMKYKEIYWDDVKQAYRKVTLEAAVTRGFRMKLKGIDDYIGQNSSYIEELRGYADVFRPEGRLMKYNQNAEYTKRSGDYGQQIHLKINGLSMSSKKKNGERDKLLEEARQTDFRYRADNIKNIQVRVFQMECGEFQRECERKTAASKDMLEKSKQSYREFYVLLEQQACMAAKGMLEAAADPARDGLDIDVNRAEDYAKALVIDKMLNEGQVEGRIRNALAYQTEITKQRWVERILGLHSRIDQSYGYRAGTRKFNDKDYPIHTTLYLGGNEVVSVKRQAGSIKDAVLGTGVTGFHVTAEVHSGDRHNYDPHAYRGGIYVLHWLDPKRASPKTREILSPLTEREVKVILGKALSDELSPLEQTISNAAANKARGYFSREVKSRLLD